jgi:hypothetical protein
MTFQIIGKLAGVAVLTIGLAGCIDATVDVEVQSETNAKATMTQVMGADIYSMVKMGAEQATEGTEPAETEDFCEGGELTEGTDGSATCVISTEGAFADLDFGKDSNPPTFTSAGPGLVKVAFPTADMKAGIGAGGEEAMDEETKAMMQAFFEGHSITLRVTGTEIVDGNMTVAGDKKSAELVIPFMDLINGTAELPDEIFAVVKVN